MILEAKAISKTFFGEQRSLEVLKNISLHVDVKQTIAILGRSGSGKSTLLSLLAGLDQPTSGRITINGRSWSEMSEAEAAEGRSKTIGLIFQQFHLLPHLTARENIALPLELQQKQVNEFSIVELLLNQVGLLDRADHYPHQLSRGENQRVAIARALTMRPQVLLADEPTASLDDETSKVIGDLLFKLPEEFGTSLVIATHDPDLAKRCRQQWRIRQGSLESERL